MGTNLDFVWDWQGNMIQDQTAFTSIHEVVHLLTLNNTQIAETEGNGSTFMQEKDVVIQMHMSMFFTISFSQIFFRKIMPLEKMIGVAFTAFYQKYRDHFVNEYAATNSVEDIAESFLFFVMGNILRSSVRDQKVQFFNNYPQLVCLRDQITSNINFQINLNGITSARSYRFRSQQGGKSIN